MSFCRLENNLSRWKSTGALDAVNTNFDSINKSVSNSCNNISSAQDESVVSSVTFKKFEISALKGKILKLQDMIQQLQNKLTTMKNDVEISYGVKYNVVDLIEDSAKMLDEIKIISRDLDCLAPSPNSQAKCLLAAIESKQTQSVDGTMRDAISKLSTFLEDDNGKDGSFNEVENLSRAFEGCFLENFPGPYRPIIKLTNWVHSLFTRTLTNTSKAVDEFEKGSALLLKAIRKPLLSVDGVYENHLDAIELNEDFKLQNNVKKSCEKLPKLMSLEINLNEESYAESLPPSPPQPADPEVSIIDHLMQSAVINKRIAEGQFNAAFEEALGSCNLALVMAACRAADPAHVFDACCLSQAVLLSLVQQLATDMVHETQLKCRYLEEAIINLDVSDNVTRAHLPVVVDEVRKHLSKFVRAYPYHVASRRIALIVMAADNLMK